MKTLNREMGAKKKETSPLNPNNALVGHNWQRRNLKSEKEREEGRELFLDRYQLLSHNDS